jgi:hypothetical protein
MKHTMIYVPRVGIDDEHALQWVEQRAREVHVVKEGNGSRTHCTKGWGPFYRPPSSPITMVQLLYNQG